MLQKLYLNLLRDLTEIERINLTACFWEGEFYYQLRNWRTCLRSNLDLHKTDTLNTKN